MIPKWLLQLQALSTYIEMFKGMEKGSRKRKVGGSYLKNTSPTSLFLSLVDLNYIACPIREFNYL